MKKLSLVLIILVCFTTAVLGSACSGPAPELKVEKTFSVSHNQATLEVDETLQLVAVCGTEEITFSCDGDAVTVSENGLITAKKVGVSTVVIKAGSQTRSCVVTVIMAEYSVKISATTNTMVVGANLILNASVLRDGQEFGGTVVWTVDKQSGFTLSQEQNKAVFKPTIKGEYKITATYNNKQSDTITIKVIDGASDLA